MRFARPASRVHKILTAVLPGALLLVGGVVAPAAAETRVGGTLQGNVAWTKEGSPYIVEGDIVVGRNATLRVGPGVTVRFKADIASRGGYNDFDLELLVKGKLIVEGAEGDSVFFTSDATSPRWEDWQGIVVQGKDARLEMKGAVVEYALMGVRCIDGSVRMQDSTIRRSMQHGLSLIRGKAELERVVFAEVGNSGGTGVGVNLERASEVHLRRCSVIGVQNGLVFSQKSTGTVVGSVVALCISRGVVVHNSTPEFRRNSITGNQIGIVVSGGASPVFQENNIYENINLDVEVKQFDGEPAKLDFTRNYWGDAAVGIVEERIQDGLDDPQVKAFTVLEPLLTESVVIDEEATSKP